MSGGMLGKVELAAALAALGRQPVEELPQVAVECIAENLDSPSLRELAGENSNDTDRVWQLFAAAMEELGIAMPDQRAAHWCLVRNIARAIIGGSIPPAAGAQQIWAGSWHELGRPAELSRIVALAIEWDDNPSGRAAIDRDIREAAMALLTRAGAAD